MDMARKRRATAAGPSFAGTYYRWARFYDLIFDWPFRPGRLAAAKAVEEAAPPGGEVLVAGVGTGLELGLLPRTARITGIDFARPMLDIARGRVRRRKLEHVEALRVMDAGALEFGEASFDVALAPYLLSVVPSPSQVLDEMWRVTRVGGEMILLNHFSADAGLQARAEQALAGAGAWLGWRPHFPHAVIGDWLARRRDAVLVHERRLAPFGLITLIRVRKGQPGGEATA